MKQIALALTMLAAIGMSFGCHDSPHKPEPVEYRIYLNHQENGVVYVISADSLNVIDSILNVGFVKAMACSPDGRWLYAQIREEPTAPDKLLRIDLSHELDRLETTGSASQLNFLADGKWLLRGSIYCFDYISTELIDPTTLMSATDFSDSLCRQSGPISGTLVAALISDASHRIHVTDVLTGSVYGTYNPRSQSNDYLSPVATILDASGDRVIVLGQYSRRVSWFVVGDVHTDSTLLDKRLFYAQGNIAVSDDGHWAAVTDPSNEGHWDSPTSLDIFDLESMAPVDLTGVALQTAPGQIQFLPGTDILVVTKTTSFLTIRPVVIQLISAANGATINYRQIASGSIGAMAVGIAYRD